MRLGELQRACKDAGIPVMFVFEGFGASGKGTQINELIYGLDPGLSGICAGKTDGGRGSSPISVAVLDKDAAAGADRGF